MTPDRRTPTVGPLSHALYAGDVNAEVSRLYDGINMIVDVDEVESTANKIIGSVSPPLDAYKEGQIYSFEVGIANTGAVQADFGRGLKSVVDVFGNALSAAALAIGPTYTVMYRGGVLKQLGVPGVAGSPGTSGAANQYATLTAMQAVAVVDQLAVILAGRVVPGDAGGGVFVGETADLSSLLVLATVTGNSSAGADTIAVATSGLYSGMVCVPTVTQSGITTNVRYWITVVTEGAPGTIKLSTSYANLLAAVYVDLTSSVSHTLEFLTDPEQGAYVIASGSALRGTNGAWIRNDDGQINLKKMGATGAFDDASQTGPDDTPYILGALGFARKSLVGSIPYRAELFAPPGNYLLNLPVRCVDFGVHWVGTGNVASQFYINHDGFGFRFERSESGMRHVSVVSTDVRAALSTDIMASGVVLWNAAGSTQNAGIEFDHCIFNDHPGCGLLYVGSGGRVSYIQARNNKIHGICLDTGRIIMAMGGSILEADIAFHGFTKVVRPICTGNGGHGLVIGHPDDTAAKSRYRDQVESLDSAANATDAAVYYHEDDSALIGVGIEARSCGVAASGSGGLWYIAGTSIEVHKQRVVGSGTYVAYVDAVAGIATAAIVIDIATVVSGAATPLNPAVVVDPSVDVNASVNVYAASSANITAAKTIGTGGITRLGNVSSFRGAATALDGINGVFLGNLADDTVFKVEIVTPCALLFAVTAQQLAGRAALVWAQVGAGPYCEGINFLAGTVEFGTGALAAGGGTDTKLTINTHTDNCIYISNRTGSTRTYWLSVLSGMHTSAIVQAVTTLT